jgi:hypothetical protein
MITNEPRRAIRSASWGYDSRTVLYTNDNDGDENFHLFAVDAAPADGGDPPMVRDLTPGRNVKAQNVITNRRYLDQILVGTNERDPRVFDMYRVFYKTGEKFLDTINPGDVIGWKTEDESFEIRAAVRPVSVGGFSPLVFNAVGGPAPIVGAIARIPAALGFQRVICCVSPPPLDDATARSDRAQLGGQLHDRASTQFGRSRRGNPGRRRVEGRVPLPLRRGGRPRRLLPGRRDRVPHLLAGEGDHRSP